MGISWLLSTGGVGGWGVLLLEKLCGRVWESAARWPKLRYPIYDCCDWQSCPEHYEGLLLMSITKDEIEASSKKHTQFRGYKNTSPIYDQDALNWYPISDQNSWPILFWAAHSPPPHLVSLPVNCEILAPLTHLIPKHAYTRLNGRALCTMDRSVRTTVSFWYRWHSDVANWKTTLSVLVQKWR